jgi:uncharacterized protein (TIGR02996 family)
MRLEDAFVRDILADPADRTPYLVFADWLEEHDQPGLAFTYRWMTAHGHRPGERKRKRVVKPWAWWRPGSHEGLKEEDLQDVVRCSHAVLPILVYHAVTGSAFNWYAYFKTWEEAVAALEAGLVRLQELLAVPS